MKATETNDPVDVTRGSVGVRALGVPLVLDVPARLETRVRDLWHLCLDDGATAQVGAVTVVAGGPDDGTVRRVRTASDTVKHAQGGDDDAYLLQRLTQSVTKAAIAGRAGQALMFHAGGLCDLRTGASIAFVAPGGTGKTTLTRRLGPGRGYLSDETIAIEADSSISIYPKPLSLRRTAGLIKDETSPGSLGLVPPPVRPWLAGLVLLRRDLEPSEEVRVEHGGLLDAIAALTPETSSLSRLDQPLKRLAALLEQIGGAPVVHYGDADSLVPLVDDILSRSR